jgi:threonine synthase
MWRFADLLGITPPPTGFLGEGDTPLLAATESTLGGPGGVSVSFKAEYQNPTGSFKDRIAAMAGAIIARDGLRGAVGTSSGNGGAAIAAYGARGDFPVVLFTVSGIVEGKLQQILAHGTVTHIVTQLGSARSDAAGIAPSIAAMAKEQGWLAFLTGARYAPEAMRGAETIAFELATQRPDATAVYVPVGGGGLVASIWRGYRRMGLTPPRIVGVQPAGCPTLSRGVQGELDALSEPITTTVSGLQVPILFDFDAVLAVTESGGHVVEVSDEQVWGAQRLLSRGEGLFVEPAGAAATAGLLADIAAGEVASDDDVVVILSGAGHKDPTSADRLGGGNQARRIEAAQVSAILAAMKDAE